MITVSISREVLELNDNQSITLHEAINLIEREGLKNNEIVTAVTIHGETIPVDLLGEFADVDLDNLGNPTLEIKNSVEIAMEALQDSNTYIDTLNAKIHEIVGFYNENNIDEANANFSDLIDLIDLYIQLISKVHRTVKNHNPTFFKNNETIRNLEIHLLSVLKALIPAKEKNDIIMLCDLLEYELVDNLAQWKIKAIPLMIESGKI
ncbi:hypothetical protein [Bacteriovorax sp. Seq25_V]|uniref:hypothetical protein n=1 Tax=Bacteriovorax sp. Seq25_V TaxID=1201288 RepID=UPI00038A0977|nr:hypothetical protein [Bacteriovorax sp. Seq25_V]EQC43282.1 hypothetical protein M900_0164 [Bacteriovorax sp. Seq25_V]